MAIADTGEASWLEEVRAIVAIAAWIVAIFSTFLIWLEEEKGEREECQEAERQDAERRRCDSFLRAIVAIAAWIVVRLEGGAEMSVEALARSLLYRRKYNLHRTKYLER